MKRNTQNLFFSSVLLVIMLFVYPGCGTQGVLIQPVSPRQHLAETQIKRDPGLLVFDKIAVIDVDGIMVNRAQSGWLCTGENPVSLLQEKLDKAGADNCVKAVILRINSPGGSVTASDMMYQSVQDFKKVSGKPVVAYMLDTSASGGYYFACAGDGIMAQPTSITGSIGTIFQSVSFAGTLNKLGIKAEAIKSRELKDLGSPLHDLRPEEKEILQGIINRFYEQFLEIVLKNREGLTRDQLLDLADGRVFTAGQALQAGLIDKIGYPQDAIAWAKGLSGLNKVKVVMYHRPMGYKPNIYASADHISPSALVNLELPAWLRAEGPQFLYLWQPQMGTTAP